jgi:hypothetical protein
MKQKLMLLVAGALTALAFAAVPAVATAGEWTIDPETGGFPLTFSGTTGEAKLTSSLGTVTAKSVDVHGEYENGTTGHVEFTFTEVSGLGGTCTSTVPAAPSGTVTTTSLTFHNIMIDSTTQKAGGTPGILITPNSEHFTTFKCPLATVEVRGNGIIGDITDPTCSSNVFQSTAKIDFESLSTGVQKYQQVTTEGTKFDLTAKSALGTVTASEDAEGTITFARKAKMTCP